MCCFTTTNPLSHLHLNIIPCQVEAGTSKAELKVKKNKVSFNLFTGPTPPVTSIKSLLYHFGIAIIFFRRIEEKKTSHYILIVVIGLINQSEGQD